MPYLSGKGDYGSCLSSVIPIHMKL